MSIIDTRFCLISTSSKEDREASSVQRRKVPRDLFRGDRTVAFDTLWMRHSDVILPLVIRGVAVCDLVIECIGHGAWSTVI